MKSTAAAFPDLGPIQPTPPKPPKAKVFSVPKPPVADKPKLPQVEAGKVKEIDGETCTRCNSKHVARPIRQAAVCSDCGHQMNMSDRGRQRPVTRADVLGTSRFGTPFRF